ncbi:hypothetical protein [Falsiroseomonas stagni]|uniref:Tetratricopeptide repeat-containing protein n=1 Tax=Falsiroseomonas stagni DSM 19981 TaxID=1123062 RepID=A0A1I4CF81_9PROT|nr:hypothetical protein [Falsiroseomonas stagni]SFK79854.1 hypothetical protein SAMN02745775_107212 [Falsiroseomonas stagni DSM 19981]
MIRQAATLLCLILPAFPVAAQDRVPIRVGDHPTHGRVVFDWPRQVGYRVEEAEGKLTLRFAAPAEFDGTASSRPVRNLRSLAVEGEVAEFTLAPGARARHFRLGNRIIVDVMNPGDATAPPAPSPVAATTPAPAPRAGTDAAPAAPRQAPPSRQAATPPPPPPAPPLPTRPTPQPAPQPASRVAEAPAPLRAPETARAPAAAGSAPRAAAGTPPNLPIATAPVVPVAQQPLPAPGAAPQAATPPAAPRGTPVRLLAGPAIAVPSPAGTGAALFRRGQSWVMVLDAPLALDLSPLGPQATLAGSEVSASPQATTLRLPLAAFAAPRLRREGPAWVIDSPAEPMALRSILPELDPGPPPRIMLRAAQAGASVNVVDPETGSLLLVGTVKGGAEAVPLGRRGAAFDLLPTRLGAALLPRSDSVTLVAREDRFIAAGAPGAPLVLGLEPPAATSAAAAMSRLFDLPAEAPAALQERVRNAASAVAAAPPLSRGPARLRHAEALLALGLPQEAQSMATLAMRDDPRLAETQRARALHGASALLSGRVAEATGLDHSGADSDELAMWRGLLAMARGQAGTVAGAAPGGSAVAATLPLMLSYPEPLLARMLPMAAEALAEQGEIAAARRLVAAREADDPALALPRARIAEAAGEVDAALAGYDSLIAGRDRRARAIAIRRAAELRLATGRIDAAGAAAALETALAAWRGDALESDARLRLAELREAAGDPRGAFDLLRETETIFPDLAATIRPRQSQALVGAIGREPPIQAVALFDSHVDLLPPGEGTEQALGSLADRLAALDLVDRATHVLRRGLARAAGAEARARIGVRLANLALGAGDAAGAVTALEETAAPGLPATLAQERRLLEARALTRAGRVPEAVARYREAGPQAAPELAALLAEQQDWAGAATAMQAHLATVLPPAGTPLSPEHRPLIARTAALLALAGNESALAALREAEQPRMAGGPLEEAFGVITAARIAGLDDLPRLRQELDVARLLPGRLDGLRETGPVTR